MKLMCLSCSPFQCSRLRKHTHRLKRTRPVRALPFHFLANKCTFTFPSFRATAKIFRGMQAFGFKLCWKSPTMEELNLEGASHCSFSIHTCSGPADHHHPRVAERPARGDVPRPELFPAVGQRLRHCRVPHLNLEGGGSVS